MGWSTTRLESDTFHFHLKNMIHVFEFWLGDREFMLGNFVFGGRQLACF